MWSDTSLWFWFVFLWRLINSVERLFMWLLALFISTLEKCLFYPLPYLNWVVFLLLNWKGYFFAIHILDIKPLSDTWTANIFSHSVGRFFIFLMMSFEAQASLILMMYSWFFSCVIVLLVSYLRIFCQILGYEDYPYVFPKRLIILPLKFRSLIYFG